MRRSIAFRFVSSSAASIIAVLLLLAIIIGQGQNIAIVVAQDVAIEEEDNNNIINNNSNSNTDNDVENNNDNNNNNNNDNSSDNNNVLLWSSTGGGWRAMFAAIGYANVFQQAGIMGENFTKFDSIATVSGGSWFSTQLFYSNEFYDQTVLAESPLELEQFVIQWMGTYYNISSIVSNETLVKCDTSKIDSDSDSEDDKEPNYDPDNEPSDNLFDLCILLEEYNFDWAQFMDAMLTAASTEYGDPNFTSLKVSPNNRHTSMKKTDLLIQAALTPNSRVRHNETNSTTGVYLGYDDNEETKLFTVPLSFAIVIDDSGTKYVYGTDDITNNNSNIEISGSGLYTYTTDNTPVEFSWKDWLPFYLYPGNGGNIIINSTDLTIGDTPVNKVGKFQQPFNGSDQTTVIQAASISSSAGGPYSPLNPSVYAHTFSIGSYTIEGATLATVWRVLAGLAVGLFVGVIIGYLPLVFCQSRDDDDDDDDDEKKKKKERIRTIMIVFGVCCGIVVACLTGVFVGAGSIVIPNIYDNGVERVYNNSDFDAFAVCSQWPFPCGEQDSMIIDGWLIDNPALVINIGHHQQKYDFDTTTSNSSNNKYTLKVIITNTNQKWDGDEWDHAQILQYFSTYFNQNIPPGGFLWGPGYFAPYRSPQIFQEYVSTSDIDALIKPIFDSNMTTARLNGTTIDNPSFGVYAGQQVEILLLNLNEDITTLVVGKDNVEKYTQPLADMTRHIASNQELVERVRNFVEN